MSEKPPILTGTPTPAQVLSTQRQEVFAAAVRDIISEHPGHPAYKEILRFLDQGTPYLAMLCLLLGHDIPGAKERLTALHKLLHDT